MYRSNDGCAKCNLLFLFAMKIKCKECNGEGAYEVACWETSRMVNCECSYCDGQGYNEEDIEEYDEDDDDPVTNSDENCDYISPELKEISDTFEMFYRDISMSFTGQPTRNYHITYFIERGDVEKEATPLLGGLTLNAAGITHAITSFINSTGVAESEIKYIVEL